MQKVIIYIAVLFLGVQSGHAQFNSVSGIWGSPLHKARQLYNQQLYEEAITYYLKDLDEGNYHEETTLGLANSYWMIGEYEMAKNNYSVIAQTSTFPEPEYMFRYAETLLSSGELQEAEQWYGEYWENVPQDSRALKKLQAIRAYQKFKADSSLISITTLQINSGYNDFGMVPYGDGFVFSSSREKDLIIRHDHLRESEALLDLYFTEGLKTNPSITRIKLPQHWRSNDGPVAIGSDLIAVTRNDVKERESTRQLGLYFIQPTDEKVWSNLKPFQHNSKAYSIAHPSFADGTDTLFLSSNMPGGFGGYDLYMSFREPDGWSEPLNLGEGINSEGDESFPYFHRDTLYFSSNGLVGMGGMDLYYTVFARNAGRNPQNLGYPANTGWDDFAIYIQDGKGYFTSNRPGGKGRDDIYEISIEYPKYSVITLMIGDQLNLSNVAGAEVIIHNQRIDTLLLTNESGEIRIRLRQDSYDISITHSNYHNLDLNLNLKGRERALEEVYLYPTLIFQKISLDSILFELNEFNISGGAREELRNIINIMNDYPHLKLKISAHTDSRGQDDYNLKLSEMRAASTANFLIRQGINPERIIHHGYGEEMLLNDCGDTKDCSESEHGVNRRIEFQFIEEDK